MGAHFIKLMIIAIFSVGVSASAWAEEEAPDYNMGMVGEQAEGEFMPGLTTTETEDLGNGLYTFRWQAYRSIFLVDDEGVIVTDPISVDGAKRYLEEIRKITDKPIKYVVYSHSHWDHATGGQIFKDEGATFVAQERCLDQMTLSPHPDVIPPDVTFKNNHTVTVGKQSLDLHYWGPSHDTCLVVMVAKPHNMLFSVDIVTPPEGRYMPWDPMAADYHFYNAVHFMEEMEALVKREGITQMIGAHLVPQVAGPGKFKGVASVGPVTAIAERREFWDSVIKAVKAEMDKGTVSFMVSETIDKTPFEDVRDYREENFKLLVDRIASFHSIGH